MISFDLNSPREMELFAQLIAELQSYSARFQVEQEKREHRACIYFLNQRGERI